MANTLSCGFGPGSGADFAHNPPWIYPADVHWDGKVDCLWSARTPAIHEYRADPAKWVRNALTGQGSTFRLYDVWEFSLVLRASEEMYFHPPAAGATSPPPLHYYMAFVSATTIPSGGLAMYILKSTTTAPYPVPDPGPSVLAYRAVAVPASYVEMSFEHRDGRLTFVCNGETLTADDDEFDGPLTGCGAGAPDYEYYPAHFTTLYNYRVFWPGSTRRRPVMEIIARSSDHREAFLKAKDDEWPTGLTEVDGPRVDCDGTVYARLLSDKMTLVLSKTPLGMSGLALWQTMAMPFRTTLRTAPKHLSI